MTPQSKPARVLVVDDDEMSRDLLAALLEGEGYTVRTADSGESALEQLRVTASPDFVLVDVQLPGIAGADLAEELSLACGPDTLLLAMSGSQPSPEAIAGFDGFLLKPFRMSQVAASLVAGKRPAGVPATRRKRERQEDFGTLPPSPPGAEGISISASSEEPASNSYTPAIDRPPVLNEKIYGQLAGSMPTRQLHEMYAMCIHDARARIGAMREMAAACDAARFVREAHSIKGGCGMLGASELHRLAAELERSGLEGETRDVNSLDELAAACDRLERMLNSRV